MESKPWKNLLALMMMTFDLKKAAEGFVHCSKIVGTFYQGVVLSSGPSSLEVAKLIRPLWRTEESDSYPFDGVCLKMKSTSSCHNETTLFFVKNRNLCSSE